MEINLWASKVKSLILKYKFVAIVLLVGLALMLLPGFEKDNTNATTPEPQKSEVPLEASLSKILSKVQGAGRVEVMLNIEQGAKTIYQVDDDISQGESSYSDRNQTVTLTDGQRNQYGLVQQVNPPIYLGAVVLCQGAGDPVVKLSVVEAVSKITGLNANQICVLKME